MRVTSEWHITNRSKSDFAVGELQKYLAQIGVDLPISEGSSAIIVGLRDDIDANLPKASGHDGYAVSIAGDEIIIAGDNEHGVIYGVYDLLEKLGCRWFYPTQDSKDPEVVPRLDVIQLEEVSWAKASPIPIRICNASAFFFEINAERMTKQLDAAMKARYNGIGWQCDHRTYVGDQYQEMVEVGVIGEMKKRGMLLHGPAHSFIHFMKEEYFEEHPDWFGMKDGQRLPQLKGMQFCWSNNGARKKFVDNAEQFVLESPAIDIFCTIGNDGGQACQCPECKKSEPTDLAFLLINELIERLQVSAPRVMVETVGAYGPVSEPPKVTKAHPKLRVIWAHWGRYHGFGFDDPRYDMIGNLETWRKAVKGLTLCMYYTDNFATPWISAPYTKVLSGDRRYILDKGIDAVYMLVYPEGYWWNHGLNCYMSGRCYYDASLSPLDVLRDYAVTYYGKDAGPLLAAYYVEWAREIDLCYHVKDNATDADRAMLAQQRLLWIDPATRAVKGDPVLSHRVDKVAKLHDLAERMSESHRRRQKIEQLRAGGEFKEAKECLKTAKKYVDDLLAHMTKLGKLNQGLIDEREVPGFISLGLKGWIEKEEKAINAKSRQIES